MNVSSSDSKNGVSLRINDVSKTFAGLRALDHVSMELQPGEILGLIGPNGSGKTTLINVVTGLLPATEGTVSIGQTDLTNKPAHYVARAGLSRTFQTIRLFRELTVTENVEVAAVSVGVPRTQARERARAALEEMRVAEYAKVLAGELPYGHERRVEVARALAMEPKFLLLDEPAAGLNEDESDELLTILAPIPRTRRLGMLIVEHDMRLIMRLCHRLQVLNYGKTVAQGSPDEIRRNPAVIQAYLGKNVEGVQHVSA